LVYIVKQCWEEFVYIGELQDKMKQVNRQIADISSAISYMSGADKAQLRELLGEIQQCEQAVQHLENSCIIKLSVVRVA
jgi:uncharacterized phage infection (PIP) family protein YhgE